MGAPRLDEIRSRLAAATPGPWLASRDAIGDGIFTDYVHGPNFTITRHYGNSPDRDHQQMPADADLIAHAPEDIAHLLEIATRAEAVLRELQDYMDLHDHDPLYLPSYTALAKALGWSPPDA